MTTIRGLALVGALMILTSMHSAAQHPAGQSQPMGIGGMRDGGTRLLAGTRVNFSTIQGNALSSTNGQLPNAAVRLRDARFGRIIDAQVSDKSGLFSFRVSDPGNYIVEMMGGDQTVLAASQVLSVNAGEAVSAVVKLPFRVPPFAGILGQSTSSALAVVTEAATSTIASVAMAGDATCDLGEGSR